MNYSRAWNPSQIQADWQLDILSPRGERGWRSDLAQWPGAVVRALASHQCSPGSIPGLGDVCSEQSRPQCPRALEDSGKEMPLAHWMPVLRLPVMKRMRDSLRTEHHWACVMSCWVKKKGAKYYEVRLFLVPLSFTQESRENENAPRSQSRENGRTGFYRFVSLSVRTFIYHLYIVYCQLNMESISVTSCPHTFKFVNVCCLVPRLRFSAGKQGAQGFVAAVHPSHNATRTMI